MISERIKELREQSKMTQTELANKIGITRSSVNAWEMGVSVPSVQYLFELVRIFKISSDYLLGLDDSISVSIGHLGPDERKYVLDLVTVLSDYTEAMILLHENNMFLRATPILHAPTTPQDKKRGKNKDQP
jgi:transcriptional regulator with XRE-family HTH domain